MSSCVNFETLCLFQPYLRASRKALCASLFSSYVHTALFPTFSWAGKLAPSYFSLRHVFLLPLAFVRPKFRNFVYVSACFPRFLFAAVLCFLSPCTVIRMFSHIWEEAREKCAQPSVWLGPSCAFIASISESLCVRCVRVSFSSSQPDLSPRPHLPGPGCFLRMKARVSTCLMQLCDLPPPSPPPERCSPR